MSNNLLDFSRIYLIIFTCCLSSCTIYEPSRMYDPENEGRMKELFIKRDFVSQEERNAIDAELKFREIKRDGYTFPELNIDLTREPDVKTEKQKQPDNKVKRLNQLIDQQLHGPIKLEKDLLTVTPNASLEPSR